MREKKEDHRVIKLFTASVEKCACDVGIKNIMKFIKIIMMFEKNTLDCPMLDVSFGDNYINARFYDCNNSSPCIYRNMLHRKQVDDEETINRLIGEVIYATELPQGTQIQWEFDSDKNKYEGYALSYHVDTVYKNCAKKYSEIIKALCMQEGIKIANTSGIHIRIEINK